MDRAALMLDKIKGFVAKAKEKNAFIIGTYNMLHKHYYGQELAIRLIAVIKWIFSANVPTCL
jgi:hypothetical protein